MIVFRNALTYKQAKTHVKSTYCQFPDSILKLINEYWAYEEGMIVCGGSTGSFPSDVSELFFEMLTYQDLYDRYMMI